MARHEAGRRTLREWIRDNLRQMVSPRVGARLIRQDPRLLWWLLLDLAISYGLLLVALVVLGQLGAFHNLAVYPGLLAGSLFGDRLTQRRDDLKRAAVSGQSVYPVAAGQRVDR